jgi:hypothetical protein
MRDRDSPRPGRWGPHPAADVTDTETVPGTRVSDGSFLADLDALGRRLDVRGRTVALVEHLIEHPDLRSLARRVTPGEDATPPGHRAL